MKLGVGKMDGVLGLIGGFVGFLFGGWSMALTIFLAVQVLDIITGILKAFKEENVDAKLMRDGLIEKIGVWIAIILAHFADVLLFGGQPIITTSFLFALTGQEGVSIIQNLIAMGIYVPAGLAKYFVNIKTKGENELEDGSDEFLPEEEESDETN